MMLLFSSRTTIPTKLSACHYYGDVLPYPACIPFMMPCEPCFPSSPCDGSQLVLPLNGIAGPGTHTLEILLEALTSKGVTARCTRGACPSAGGNEFVVALACGRLQRACAQTPSTAVTFGGQDYSLVATEGMIRVAGTGEAGLYYGVCTLCQILG